MPSAAVRRGCVCHEKRLMRHGSGLAGYWTAHAHCHILPIEPTILPAVLTYLNFPSQEAIRYEQGSKNPRFEPPRNYQSFRRLAKHVN